MRVYLNNIFEKRDEAAELVGCDRVLWMHRETDIVITISVVEKSPLPIFRSLSELEGELESGLCRKLDYDPYQKFMVSDEVLTAKEIWVRDQAWDCIKDIVELEPRIYNPKERYELIKEAVKEKGKGKKFFYKYLRYYWTGGKSENALLPRFRKCGAKGKRKNPTSKMGRPRKTRDENEEYSGVIVTEGIRKIFDASITKFYNNRRRNSVKFAYIRMLGESFNIEIREEAGVEIPIIPPDHLLPSLAQFRYHLRTKGNRKKTLIKREGEVNFDRDLRPLLGSETRRATGPGQIFQTDSTIADVYLRSEDDPNDIIGRPVVYMVSDVFSHIVPGFYIGLEGPSWQGNAMAIENTAANKVSFCAEYGITIEENEWPCHHMPQIFFADRGEMESKQADSLGKSLGIKIKNAPPYRADLKGIIEQKFRTLNLTLQPWMPGAVKKEYQKRGGPDYVLDAKLTLRDFTRMFIQMVIYHNNYHYMEHYPLDKALAIDQVRPIPRDIWEWGVAHDHFLKEVPIDIVRLNVLPEEKAKASRQGIYFKRMYYGCEELTEQGWFIKGKSIETMIAFDRRCMDHVYVKTDKGRGFIKCPLLEKSSRYRGLSLEEIKEIQHQEDIRHGLYMSTERQAEVTLHAKLSAIEQTAVVRTEQDVDHSIPKTQQKANIRANRKTVRDKLRKDQYFELGEKQASDEQPIVDMNGEQTGSRSRTQSKLSFLANINKEAN
ncbi:Mu transposase C-terminal domain-containing protein [Paenibacillus agricola]|uniref:Transposase n=1 Tax=Paenibacillus agricola TaxID=2716264 RepID=A0ABX0JCG5_9BACL|nr:Mu transposase C-terminal domain-containing protein [Paenibacillus agricola]NHN31616.1 transposase [Paenibacillus agricola]